MEELQRSVERLGESQPAADALDSVVVRREAARGDQLRRACLLGDDQLLEATLAALPLDEDVPKVASDCLLRVAANASVHRPSLTRCAHLCLRYGADAWRADERGDSALHRACARRDRAMAEVLLVAGARSDAPSASDGNSAAFRLLGPHSDLWSREVLASLRTLIACAHQYDGRVARHLLLIASCVPPRQPERAPRSAPNDSAADVLDNAESASGARVEDECLSLLLSAAMAECVVVVLPAASGRGAGASALTVSAGLVALRDALAAPGVRGAPLDGSDGHERASGAGRGRGASAAGAQGERSAAEGNFNFGIECACVLPDERTLVELRIGGARFATLVRWSSAVRVVAVEVRPHAGADTNTASTDAPVAEPRARWRLPASHRQLLRLLNDGDASAVVSQLMHLEEGATSIVVVLDSNPPPRLEPLDSRQPGTDAGADGARGVGGRVPRTLDEVRSLVPGEPIAHGGRASHPADAPGAHAPPSPVVPPNTAVALAWADALAYVRALVHSRLGGRIALGGVSHRRLALECLSASCSRATVQLGDGLALVQTAHFAWEHGAGEARGAGGRIAALVHEWLAAPAGAAGADGHVPTRLPRALPSCAGRAIAFGPGQRSRRLHITVVHVELTAAGGGLVGATSLRPRRCAIPFGSRVRLELRLTAGRASPGSAPPPCAVLYGLAAAIVPSTDEPAGDGGGSMEWHVVQQPRGGAHAAGGDGDEAEGGDDGEMAVPAPVPPVPLPRAAAKHGARADPLSELQLRVRAARREAPRVVASVAMPLAPVGGPAFVAHTDAPRVSSSLELLLEYSPGHAHPLGAKADDAPPNGVFGQRGGHAPLRDGAVPDPPHGARAAPAACGGLAHHRSAYERAPRRELLGAHTRLIDALRLPLSATRGATGARSNAGAAGSVVIADGLVGADRALALRRQRIGRLLGHALCELWTVDGGARASGRARVLDALCTPPDGETRVAATPEAATVRALRPWPRATAAVPNAGAPLASCVAAPEPHEPAPGVVLFEPSVLLAADVGAALGGVRHARARAIGPQSCTLALLECEAHALPHARLNAGGSGLQVAQPPPILLVQVAYWAVEAGREPALIGLLHGRVESVSRARRMAAELVLTWAEGARATSTPAPPPHQRAQPRAPAPAEGAAVRFCGHLALPDTLLCAGTPIQLEVPIDAARPPPTRARTACERGRLAASVGMLASTCTVDGSSAHGAQATLPLIAHVTLQLAAE
ncbi:hypothetical protein KFE25_008380 [Diacronema lutheri]|uniref:ANK_REP_REGION domain-containing protein n=1 Tax=Diacronema lutheri TaxID=2081491 RepID=A0A8J5X3N9_DIALT|nr:hypothetical protein KFE25_008380 [Diacronema lutheri]